MKKKGSALIFVILILAILFTLSVGIMEVSLASLRQSVNYYNKNTAFYYADTSMEKILFYLDKIADKARQEANDYCYSSSGGPNLDNQDVKQLYEQYLNNEIDKEQFEKEIKKIFLKKFKERIYGFFKNNEQIQVDIRQQDGTLLNLLGWSWSYWKDYITQELNKNDNTEIIFKMFDEAKNDQEFKKLFSTSIDDNKFENLNPEDLSSYPKETIIIKVSLKKQNVKRYLITTFEFNPFGEKLENVKLLQKKIKRGYNGILDYGLVVGRNLFVVNGKNTLTVNGDVYVRGTGNNLEEIKPYKNFGGILVGLDDTTQDDLTLASKNTTTKKHLLQSTKGNLTINGNVFIGDLSDTGGSGIYKYKLNSGFAKVINEKSNLTINGNLYCHSIVTDDSALNSTIEIKQNAYIADNVSLYGENSKIKIDGDLISFETADDDKNYNSSSSIVINDDTAQLELGKNVVLFGVGFVDDLRKKSDPTQAFKTIETTAINPNFIVYNYKIDPIEIDSQKKLNWSSNDKDYEDYIIQDGESEVIKMFKTGEGNQTLVNRAINFLLHYLAGARINSSVYDYQYNLGNNIKANNLAFSEQGDSSYFPHIFLANNKLKIMRNINIDEEDILRQSDVIRDILEKYNVNAEAIKVNLEQGLIKNIKNELIEKILFRDKGLISNSFEDYVDFNDLAEFEINDTSKKIYIKFSNQDLTLDLKDYDDYKILLVSSKNIYINNTSSNTINVKGNIIAKEDLIIEGNSNIVIESNQDISKELLNYFNPNDYEDCIKLYKFFAKGITVKETLDIYSGFKEEVRTNIKILSRRQVLIP